MSKIQLLTALLATAANAVFAQAPILTAANNPIAGERFQVVATDTFSVGPTGVGLIWNFDTLSNYGTDTLAITTCGATAYCADFPGAVLASYNVSIPALVSYFTPSSSGVSFYGAYNTVPMSYTNQEDLLHYPLTYNDFYADSFYSVFTSAGYTYYRKGFVTVKADAYGTLNLPYGSFPNALRLKTTEIFGDSTSTGGSPYIWHYNSVAYAWYVPGYHMELLGINRMYRNSMLTTVSTYYTVQPPVGLPPVCTSDGPSQIYPNPAVNECTVYNPAGFEAGSYLSVIGIDGREVASYDLHGTKVTLPVAQLMPGLYQCRINRIGRETQVMKLVVAR